MGKSPDDIASEIGDLRKESDIIVEELLRRANPSNVARGMTATLTGRANSVVMPVSMRVSDATSAVSHFMDGMPEPVRQHPMATTYATVGLVAGLAAFAATWFSVMRQPTSAERAVQTLRLSREQAEERARDYWQQFDYLRRNLQDVRVVKAKKEPGMLKRLLWVGMTSVMATLGSMLFKKMSAGLWRTTLKEEPPKK